MYIARALIFHTRSKSRCRETDFFGPNSDFRSFTPGLVDMMLTTNIHCTMSSSYDLPITPRSVGEYTPALVPPKARDLVQYRQEQQQLTDLGLSTTKWTKRSDGKYSFTFSRSCTMTKLGSSGSVTSELTGPSTLFQNIDLNEKSRSMKSGSTSMPISPVKPMSVQGRM
jgi:hypothetical protein